jgi:hypothetical protein
LSEEKKGDSKQMPTTSSPCSWMSLTANMLSRPPEKRAKAFIKRAPFMMLDK